MLLAALTACMTQQSFALRLLNIIRSSLAVDPTITFLLAPVIAELTMALSRPVDIGPASRDDTAPPGTLALPEPSIVIEDND